MTTENDLRIGWHFSSITGDEFYEGTGILSKEAIPAINALYAETGRPYTVTLVTGDGRIIRFNVTEKAK